MKMKKRFVFTTTDKLREQIIKALDEEEKRAKVRTLPRKNIDLLIETVAKEPWGYAEGNGGYVSWKYRYLAETTYFICAWYSWRKKKYVYLKISRGYAVKVPHGSIGYLSLNTEKDKWKAYAYEFTLPDRYTRFQYLKNKRQISRAIKHLPEVPAGFGEITYVKADVGGLVYAITDTLAHLVGTPTGWLQIPFHIVLSPRNSNNYKYNKERHSAWSYLKDAGFPVPHFKKDRVWNDELAAHTAMHILGGEQ